MAKLKEIFNTDKNKSLISEIKDKLNVVISKEDGDFNDFTNAIDHDYDLPYVIDCLMYFVTGQVSKNLKQYLKCEVCSTAFFYSTEQSVELQKYPVARLITFNIENDQENLQHPNKRLFTFLKKIETSFNKHCKYSNVFELVVNEITKDELDFPCPDHAEDVYAYVISFYLQNRMRQFLKIQMKNLSKSNILKKKASKLTAY